MQYLQKYAKVIGEKQLNTIYEQATPLENKHVVHINSTYYGGGVAEMLTSLIPLFNDVGIKTGWRLIKGSPDFFSITKGFHNALQGEPLNLTPMKKKIYEQANETSAFITHIQNHDAVIIHDPQPLAMIQHYKKKQPWLWRIHIDLSKPQPEVWKYLQQFINKYDRAIISQKSYAKQLSIPKTIIHPSIDPLSNKNHFLSSARIDKTLKQFGIDQSKPIMSQISRFDKWKDPLGVIKVFKQVRKKMDCSLVLLGASATDDPEGQAIYEQIVKETKDEKDIRIINFESNTLVNALQRVSSVVLQKSLKEGFGLTVSEALWKGTPVVASKVGGIPSQIQHGKTGYLVNSIDSCAKATLKLLKAPRKAEKMGETGHYHVKKHFLITRHLADYIKLLKTQILK